MQKRSAPTPNIEKSEPFSINVADQTTFTNVPIKKRSDGLVWVPLEEAAKSLGYHFEWDKSSNRVKAGHTDVLYATTINERAAMAEDNTIQLDQAPEIIDEKPYITTQSLSQLFGSSVTLDDANRQVVIKPNDGLAKGNTANQEQSQGFSALQTVDKDALVSYARQFLGVPYEFGAGPYPSSNRFDCSSFTQYVFSHFGIKLPRSSRSQARVGQMVSRDELQKGDLLFFSVPGRFRNNQTVGHVGIYIGDNKMIHTYGSPGVTINDITGHWDKRFLTAKRVL